MFVDAAAAAQTPVNALDLRRRQELRIVVSWPRATAGVQTSEKRATEAGTLRQLASAHTHVATVSAR